LLARQYSDDPTTADSGGMLGGFLLDGLSEPFKTVVAGMDSGQISEPVLSEHGYHLVKVLELERPREMGYLEMQDGIRNYLYQQRLNQRLEEYVGRISKKVFVRRYD
jgi:parvulin-like peptidyl-prolyl isomerase